MTLLMKLIHIAAIALWMGSLLALPLLYLRRNGMPEGPALTRLHHAVRGVYIHLASPAAMLAIGSGVALAFLEDTFTPWFAAKLGVVAVLAGLHVFTVPLQTRLFNPGESYPRGRALAAMAAVSGAALAVLGLVLAKPGLSAPGLEALFRPGGLSAALPFVNRLLPLP